jgi:DNA adenine methylase
MSALLPYIGGKHRLARRIISFFPEHTTYVEAFAGGAEVFFQKPRSTVEVLNDVDGEVVNLMRVCQWHHEELCRYLKYCLMSRKIYDWMKESRPESLTDVQRAGRFVYLQKNSFGGLVCKRNYHYAVSQPPNYNPATIPKVIEKAHERLAGVQIESLPYERVFDKYDRPSTFYYLDPPYWKRTLYKYNFTEQDFITFEARLRVLRGKFLLSLNDVPEVRKLFSSFHIQPVQLSYTAQRRVGKKFQELLISNYPLRSA